MINTIIVRLSDCYKTYGLLLVKKVTKMMTILVFVLTLDLRPLKIMLL